MKSPPKVEHFAKNGARRLAWKDMLDAWLIYREFANGKRSAFRKIWAQTSASRLTKLGMHVHPSLVEIDESIAAVKRRAANFLARDRNEEATNEWAMHKLVFEGRSKGDA